MHGATHGVPHGAPHGTPHDTHSAHADGDAAAAPPATPTAALGASLGPTTGSTIVMSPFQQRLVALTRGIGPEMAVAQECLHQARVARLGVAALRTDGATAVGPDMGDGTAAENIAMMAKAWRRDVEVAGNASLRRALG